MALKQFPITLCTFTLNEEHNIRDCIESVLPVVSEVVVVDVGSTDKTVEICRKYTDRVYQVGFNDFGNIRTLTAHLANCPWVLMLDADERIMAEDWPKLEKLVDQPQGVQGDDMELDAEGNVVTDSWALPRKRWADAWMTQQEDVESYPDWQVRLFVNHLSRPKIKFVRRVHETVYGCIKTEYAEDGPTIQHMQNVHKDEEALLRRKVLYERLRSLDVAEGIEHHREAVEVIDNADG